MRQILNLVKCGPSSFWYKIWKGGITCPHWVAGLPGSSSRRRLAPELAEIGRHSLIVLDQTMPVVCCNWGYVGEMQTIIYIKDLV